MPPTCLSHEEASLGITVGPGESEHFACGSFTLHEAQSKLVRFCKAAGDPAMDLHPPLGAVKHTGTDIDIPRVKLVSGGQVRLTECAQTCALYGAGLGDGEGSGHAMRCRWMQCARAHAPRARMSAERRIGSWHVSIGAGLRIAGRARAGGPSKWPGGCQGAGPGGGCSVGAMHATSLHPKRT